MKHIKQVLFCLLLMVNVVHAQDKTLNAHLTNSDIDRFVETVVPMTVELNQLDKELANTEKGGATPEQWAANTQAMSILKKYGWNERYGLKAAAIVWGYTLAKMNQEVEKLPDDQKVQMQAMMPMLQQYESLVHKDDVALVKSNLVRIDKVIKDMEKL